MKNFNNSVRNILILILLFICSITITANAKTIAYPKQTNLKYVNDYSNLLSSSTKEKIVSIGTELEEKTSVKNILVIVNSTQGLSLEEYSNNIFKAWNINEDEKANELLILFATNDKRYRVEISSNLEHAISNDISHKIMKFLAKPYFMEGDYNKGFLNSYSKFCDYIASEHGATLDNSLNIELPNDNININSNLIFVAVIILLLIFFDMFINKAKILSSLIQIFINKK